MIALRRLADAELAMLQPLFEAVFKTPISLDLLRWKYAEGRGASWTAWEDDRLVLHCGAVYRDALIQGKPTRAAQLVDLMAPHKTAGLSRANSPFAMLMREILHSLSRPDGSGSVGDIAFGFPGDRAMRLGERLGVYRSVGRVSNLMFSPAKISGTRYRTMTGMNPRGRATIDVLWSRMAADLSGCAVGVRNAAYLERRYSVYPGKSYVRLLVEGRWLGKPLGLAVIRPDAQLPELLDVVGPQSAMPAIFAAARRWLADTGGQTLSFLLSEPFARELAPLADHCQATEFRIMANPFSPPEALRALENRWWLTGGDTDYR